MTPIVNAVKRWLLSPRTVIGLISATGAACLVASLVPQLAHRPSTFFETWRARSPLLARAADVLKLNDVFGSAWFLVLVALVASSLALSVYYEVKALVRTSRAERRAPARIPFEGSVTIDATSAPDPAGRLEARVREILARRGYGQRPVVGAGYLVFTKNRLGRWSSVVFHAGILAIILAALYGLAFQKRGFVQLVESESFDGRDAGWKAKSLGVLARDFDLDFRVSLRRFKPTYWDTGAVKNMESVLVLTDERGKRTEVPISLHGAAEFRGIRLYQSEYYGYAVDVAKDGTVHTALVDPPSDPRLALAGVELTTSPVRYWTGLSLAADYGMPGVYFGFALATLGAILIFMVPYKEIHVQETEHDGRVRLGIGGRSKSDRAIFAEELADVTAAVRDAVGPR